MHTFPIIIYTDSALTKKVRSIQQELHELTGSKACLELWEPHITVGSAVKVDDDEVADLLNDMKDATRGLKPFQINIENFNFMDNWPGGKMDDYTPYVVYLDVIVNPQLQRLAENIRDTVTSKRNCSYTMPWPYNPHLTVAFKDLNKEEFEKAKQLLQGRTFKYTTMVDHVALAEELPNGNCVVYKKWTL